MTSPLGNGLRVLQGAGPVVPYGSERLCTYVGMPRGGGSGNNPWLRSSNNAVPTITSGATISFSNVRNAVDGAYIRRGGVTNAAPCYTSVVIPELTAYPTAGAAFGALYPREYEVFVFAETIRIVSSAALPNGHRLAHGFTLVGNLLAGFPLLSAGSWRGIALFQRQIGAVTDYVVAVKDANPATVFPVTGVDLSVRTTVEHRLYAPKLDRAAKYELWINGARVIELDSTLPNWPVPLSAADTWQLLPMAMDNPGGAINVDMRVWGSQIIIGADSPGTFPFGG